MKKKIHKTYELCLLSEAHNSAAAISKSIAASVEQAQIQAKENNIEVLPTDLQISELQHLFTTTLKYEIETIKRAAYYVATITAKPAIMPILLIELQKHRIILRFICLDYEDNKEVIESLDYKRPEKHLSKMLNELGQIMPASKNGLKKKDNKQVAKAIKIARYMALQSYV